MTVTNPEPERFLSVQDVAARCSLHPSTVRRLVQRGAFPAPRAVGASRRWRAADVEAWIAAAPVAPRGPAA